MTDLVCYGCMRLGLGRRHSRRAIKEHGDNSFDTMVLSGGLLFLLRMALKAHVFARLALELVAHGSQGVMVHTYMIIC